MRRVWSRLSTGRPGVLLHGGEPSEREILETSRPPSPWARHRYDQRRMIRTRRSSTPRSRGHPTFDADSIDGWDGPARIRPGEGTFERYRRRPMPRGPGQSGPHRDVVRGRVHREGGRAVASALIGLTKPASRSPLLRWG